MIGKKFVSVFPYNSGQYLQNIAFDMEKNKGVEVFILVRLKEYLRKRNIEINTYDIPTPLPPYKYVYFDMPYPWDIHGWKIILSNIGKNILICNESSLIIPFNYWKPLHIFFNKVFTWYEPYVDKKKYFYRLWPKSTTGIETKAKPFKKKEFMVLVNSNKLPFYPFLLTNMFGKELYSERIRAIEFFEQKTPERFNLYGRGWNIPKKYNLRELLFGYKRYKTYKGTVKDKIELLSRFKFCLCFENLTDVNGYITEKLFDCLKAKCIPIYWGASDITTHVPKDCFVDFRDFLDYDKLLAFLDSMNEKTYNKYISNIENLLENKLFRKTWFEDSFAEFFYEEVLDEK